MDLEEGQSHWSTKSIFIYDSTSRSQYYLHHYTLYVISFPLAYNNTSSNEIKISVLENFTIGRVNIRSVRT